MAHYVQIVQYPTTSQMINYTKNRKQDYIDYI